MAFMIPFIPAIIGGVSAIMGARSDSAAAQAQARIDDQNARLAEQQAAENARRQRVQNRRDIGTMIANMGASGLQTFEGSNIDVLNDSLVQGELLAQDLEFQGAIKGQDLRTKAQLQRTAGSDALTGGFLSAGGSFLKQTPQFGRALSTNSSGGFGGLV